MIKKSINKFFQYVVIPLFFLSQEINADPLESYKLIHLDKKIKISNLSAYGMISDLENNLTSENIWGLDQKKDLKISYFNPKENYINFEFQINELNLKRKFKPYEKVTNRQKLVISTLQKPKKNILNDWNRYFFLSLENQNKIKINCYETKNMFRCEFKLLERINHFFD